MSYTFNWAVGTDEDAEDEAVVLTFAIDEPTGVTDADDPDSEMVTIEDAHTQTFVWGPVPKLKEAGTAVITLTARPTPVQLSYATTLVVEATGYTISPTTFTFDDDEGTPGEDGPTVTITIMAPDNDDNRVDDEITLRALVTGSVTDRVDPVTITAEDLHKLPKVTAKLTDMDGDAIPEEGVAEGTEVMLTFEVESAAEEDIKITLSDGAGNTAMMDDYSLSEMEATIEEGDTESEALTLMTMSNDDITDDMLVLAGAVTGEDANGTTAGDAVMVMLTIMDGTMLNVTPKTEAEIMKAVMDERALRAGSDNLWTADDDDLSFTAGDFFNLPSTGFDVAITPTSSNESVAYTGTDGTNIWVGAGEDNVPGETTITLTAVVSSTTNTLVTTNQNSANSVTVMFHITLDETPPPVVTAKSDADVMAAYMAARTAAAGTDGVWTTSDGPATIMLSALFDNLPDPAVGADATSSAPDNIVASVSSSSGLVLTPVSSGPADITVTANGVSVMFTATVSDPTFDTRGKITAFSIAGTTEETIDGTKRLHLKEGGIDTVTVTVTWTNEQLTALWDGHTDANPPYPAVVYLYDTSSGITDPALGQWLSLAETSELSGAGSRGGNDVVFGAREVEIKIPDAPKTNTQSTSVTASATGETSMSLPHDDDAEPEVFVVSWWPEGSSGVQYVGALQYDRLVANNLLIEDDEPQGIKLTRVGTGAIYEGGADVKFSAVADPLREDLNLDVRYDLTDSTGVSVSSQTYTLVSSVGTIGVGPAAKHEAVLNLAPNDGDRMDDMLEMHAEVVAYALNTGAYGDIDSQMVKFDVMDVHKLPPLMVMPETATLMEGNELELTLTVDRNPRETRAVDPETSQYTNEALLIGVMGSGATASDYSISSTAVAVPEYKHTAGSDWMQSVTVTVEALSDEDVEEDSMLMLDFTVNGTVAANGSSDTMSDAQASVTIQDATATLVSVRDNAYDVIKGALGDPPMLIPGMSAELMGANLFDYDANAVSVTYGTSVEGGAATASASGGTVTVMGVSAGEAKVTITATATTNASSLIVTQDKANVAQLTFPVMVADPVPALPIIAQLLLAAFLGVGGFRRYLRRR